MRPRIVLFGDSITEQSFRSGGWGAALADTYTRKADIVNRGYSGYNTRWALFLLHQLFPFDATKHPVAATIFFGANDAALLGRTSERQHVPIEEYKENLRKVVHHLKECSPTMLVVLITPPPVDEVGRRDYAQYVTFAYECNRRFSFIGLTWASQVKGWGYLVKIVNGFSRSVYGEKALELPERTNEVTGLYAKQCVELAKEMGLCSIDLWSKMQETEGWQKKFLSDGLHLTPEGNVVVHEEVVRVFNESWLSAAEMPYDFPSHSEIDGKNPEKAFHQQCI